MKRIRRILVGMLLIIVCAGGFVAGKGYRMYQEALEEKSLVQIRKETVEDENFVSAEQLPDIYKKAVVSVEDKRFYRHKGIDPIGIARAFYHNIRARKLWREEARLLSRWQKISILTWIKQLSGRLPRYLWQLRWKKNLQKRRF